MNLFLGISVLSIVDIIYCFTLRLSCSLLDRKLYMKKLPNIVNVKPANDRNGIVQFHESCTSYDQITEIEIESIEESTQYKYVRVVSVQLHDSHSSCLRKINDNIHDIVNIEAVDEQEHEIHSHSSCDKILESEITSIEDDILDQIREIIDTETQNDSGVETITETEEIIDLGND